MQNPMKVDDLEVPLFQETPTYCVVDMQRSLPHVPRQYPQHEARELPFRQGLPSQDDGVKKGLNI